MEIRIFRDMNCYSSNKPMYVSKVLNVDAFDFSKCLDVFRSIYGTDIIVVLMRVSLGIQNNNPFNIRYNRLNRWKGLTGENKGFCVFESMDYGIRAGIITLRSYINKYHLTDVASIIERWAPPAENPTCNYISYVRSNILASGHDPNLIVDIHYHTFYVLCMSIMMFESWFRCSESDIIRIINKFKL